MTKQTAVEWFNQQLVDRQNGNGDSRSRDEILEQAQQMEKQQIIDAFKNGDCNGTFETINSEQYYNQNY